VSFEQLLLIPPYFPGFEIHWLLSHVTPLFLAAPFFFHYWNSLSHSNQSLKSLIIYPVPWVNHVPSQS
jgi:hypothetical protein